MIPRYFILLLVVCLLVLAPGYVAAENGEVTIPLNQYAHLIDAAHAGHKSGLPQAAQFSLGRAVVKLETEQRNERLFGEMNVELAIKVVAKGWTVVPVLPPGTLLRSATINGEAANLAATSAGLAWAVKGPGSYTMQLAYRVEAERTKGATALSIPTPRATSLKLQATLPGTQITPSVIPAVGYRRETRGDTTVVSASFPSTTGIHLAWRSRERGEYTISRANYTGQLEEEAVRWRGEFQVELYDEEQVSLPLVPRSVTLSDVRVDGKIAAVTSNTDSFATEIRGKGRHTITAEFEVPVMRDNGPPHVVVPVAKIPITRVELSLPGKKEVTVSPKASVDHKEQAGVTLATAHVPMSDSVTFSWSEAVPQEIKAELRANAAIYHAVHAEEGVLYISALVNYDITRGETSTLQFEIPSDVDITRVDVAGGILSDWRLIKGEADKPNRVELFLNRAIDTGARVNFFYDRSLQSSDSLQIPLVHAREVHRQRGMVALLSSKELTLKPISEEAATRVGENQLPPFVRDTISMTVAHTYKYVETKPSIKVEVTEPERKQGKYDAAVYTLISISDVTLKGSATVEMNVKSGKVDQLLLKLPGGVNILNLTAPSLRTYKVNDENGAQQIDVQFTQEMEGQFRIELSYEKITSEKQSKLSVPTLTVEGTEVEHGKIAVEALSAVEVQAAEVQQLSTVDPSELPKQLILKTTNPILLAYKYVQADPPFSLALKVTRHREIDIESAAIDRAHYASLYTRDGIAVTAARYTVRNSRKQFLRVRLPADSELWAVTVNGKSEKPALAEQKEGESAGREVLIKIINSTTGFPVELVYQTPVNKMGAFGKLRGSLPRPDMIVTESQWQIYLPEDHSYGKPDTNLDVVEEGVLVNKQTITRDIARMGASNGTQVTPPPQMRVPAAGIRYSFEKLYANQSDDEARFAVPYASEKGTIGAYALVILSALLALCGILSMVFNVERVSRPTAGAVTVLGVLGLLVLIGHYGVSAMPAIVVAMLAILASIAHAVKQRIQPAS